LTSEDKVEEYDRALSTCQRILGFEMDCVLRSNVERKMGISTLRSQSIPPTTIRFIIADRPFLPINGH
jgi:hypothetical protein